MKEKELLALCREKIEAALQWGSSENWSNSDFELLSEKIFEKTQVRLSVSTLKRIWGKVKYDNYPTAATLNALAAFVGYPGWRDLQQAHATIHENSSEPASKTEEPQPRRKLFLKPVLMVALIAAVVLTAFLIVKGRNPRQYDSSLAVFKSRAVTDDLPNSVIFDYDASAFDADSVFIQQNWDPRRREKVSPDGKQHTSIYFQPGYFQAKLIINDEIVKEDVVFIKTKGWRALIENEPLPIYLSNADVMHSGFMGTTEKFLFDKTGSTVFSERWVIFNNVREFAGVNGKNFDFEVSLQNTSTVETSLCKAVLVYLLSTDGAIIVPLVAKGCISDISIFTGDGNISGKENDLSAFGTDYSQPERLHCRMSGDTLVIDRNGERIFSSKQQNFVGDIVGIRIGFAGAGEIHEIKLAAGDKQVYSEKF